MFPLQSPIFYLTSRDCPPGSPSAGHSGPGSVPGTWEPWPPSAPACRRGGSGQCCVERPLPFPSLPCCPSCCLATLSLCHCHVTIGSTKGDNLERWKKFYKNSLFPYKWSKVMWLSSVQNWFLIQCSLFQKKPQEIFFFWLNSTVSFSFIY